jgi:hypothetical protein
MCGAFIASPTRIHDRKTIHITAHEFRRRDLVTISLPGEYIINYLNQACAAGAMSGIK